MIRPGLILWLLLTVCFSLAAKLGLEQERSRPAPAHGSIMDALMSDTRRLVANHFVTKADVYLHGGVYPSIFDQRPSEKVPHLASAAVASAASAPPAASAPAEPEDHQHDAHCDHHDEHDVVTGLFTQPRDWIDAFGRNFYPTKHVHLGEKGDEREILPWLRLAADLNPQDVQIYTLSAYWLRSRMGKVQEAEQFLREGWRANPHSYEIPSELGRLYEENRGDDLRARTLFEAALREWQASESGKEKPDEFALMQLTGHLARLEERQGRHQPAIGYLERLLKVSPHPEAIQKWIDKLRTTGSHPAPQG